MRRDVERDAARAIDAQADVRVRRRSRRRRRRSSPPGGDQRLRGAPEGRAVEDWTTSWSSSDSGTELSRGFDDVSRTEHRRHFARPPASSPATNPNPSQSGQVISGPASSRSIVGQPAPPGQIEFADAGHLASGCIGRHGAPVMTTIIANRADEYQHRCPGTPSVAPQRLPRAESRGRRLPRHGTSGPPSSRSFPACSARTGTSPGTARSDATRSGRRRTWPSTCAAFLRASRRGI